MHLYVADCVEYVGVKDDANRRTELLFDKLAFASVSLSFKFSKRIIPRKVFFAFSLRLADLLLGQSCLPLGSSMSRWWQSCCTFLATPVTPYKSQVHIRKIFGRIVRITIFCKFYVFIFLRSLCLLMFISINYSLIL